MDELDRRIITLLEQDGRITHEDIGKQLHISRPTVHQRVAKLEREGILRGYRAIVDWSSTGERVKALIFVKLKCSDYQSAMKRIVSLQLPGVTLQDCHRLAGEWCIMLRVRVCDPRDITILIDEMVKDDAVVETSTTFILDTLMEDGLVQLTL